MYTKKQRFSERLKSAAAEGGQYRNVHVFIGGTGAVGGAAALQMITMFEQMMVTHPPVSLDDVPILIITGSNQDDMDAFIARLKKFTRARWGDNAPLQRYKKGYLTPGGVYASIIKFHLEMIPGLDSVTKAEEDAKDSAVDDFLLAAGTSRSASREEASDALMRWVNNIEPFSHFLEGRLPYISDYGEKPYRSLLIGVPLPSILSYETAGLADVTKAFDLDDDFTKRLKKQVHTALAADLAAIRQRWGTRVLVAHTTGVGGMYDEDEDFTTKPRLGFAHAAIDHMLRQKQVEAEQITTEYSKSGLHVLVTAAAIGIDEVRVRERIPLNKAVVERLRKESADLFQGMRARRTTKDSKGKKRSVPARLFLRILQPCTISMAIDGDPQENGPLFFENFVREGRVSKDDMYLRPEFAVRSGENGFFSVANADALYRTMKVASASELGHVLAAVALVGDDPRVPWFKPIDQNKERRTAQDRDLASELPKRSSDSGTFDGQINDTSSTEAGSDGGICYYGETANSKQVFDFLYQPPLFATQISGIDPMALQDLGSAKHQAELHALGLLILLHRLRTVDLDQLPLYPRETFDPACFFVETSRALTFRDIESWDTTALAEDLRTLVLARERRDLLKLKPLRDEGRYKRRDEAHLAVLEVVLKAVWAVPSLGSPIVVEDEGKMLASVGYYIAPFGSVIRDQDQLQRLFIDGYKEDDPNCTPFEYQLFQMSVNGFIDLRPIGVVCSARKPCELTSESIAVERDIDTFAQAVRKVKPYSFFATSGLLALVHRLRSLNSFLQTARLDLGTVQDCAWSMPRDPHGHLYVVPGVVEAFRMMSEGQEKATGTEWLDGFWGYERQLPATRSEAILEMLQRRTETPRNG